MPICQKIEQPFFNHFQNRSDSINLNLTFYPLNHRNEGNSRSFPSYETDNIMMSCLMAIINNASPLGIEGEPFGARKQCAMTIGY